jgi:hypothetical protein
LRSIEMKREGHIEEERRTKKDERKTGRRGKGQ